MKPKFRLHIKHAKVKTNDTDRVFGFPYWSCTVHFDGKSPSKAGIVRLVKHSGPCVTAASAIGEATLLWRKYSRA